MVQASSSWAGLRDHRLRSPGRRAAGPRRRSRPGSVRPTRCGPGSAPTGSPARAAVPVAGSGSARRSRGPPARCVRWPRPTGRRRHAHRRERHHHQDHGGERDHEQKRELLPDPEPSEHRRSPAVRGGLHPPCAADPSRRWRRRIGSELLRVKESRVSTNPAPPCPAGREPVPRRTGRSRPRSPAGDQQPDDHERRPADQRR